MASAGTSAAALLLSLLVFFVFFAAGARADDGAIEFSPPRARRAGPPPPSITVRAEKENCPLIRVPSLVDACRSGPGPGLPGCAASCLVYQYRGGYCDMLPHGRPGDCYCTNCLATTSPPPRRNEATI